MQTIFILKTQLHNFDKVKVHSSAELKMYHTLMRFVIYFLYKDYSAHVKYIFSTCEILLYIDA